MTEQLIAVRCIRGTLKPNLIKQAVRLYRQLTAEYKQDPGYLGMRGLFDPTANRFQTLTFWRDRAAMVEFEEKGWFLFSLTEIEHLIVGELEIEDYDQVVSDPLGI